MYRVYNEELSIYPFKMVSGGKYVRERLRKLWLITHVMYLVNQNNGLKKLEKNQDVLSSFHIMILIIFNLMLNNLRIWLYKNIEAWSLDQEPSLWKNMKNLICIFKGWEKACKE